QLIGGAGGVLVRRAVATAPAASTAASAAATAAAFAGGLARRRIGLASLGLRGSGLGRSLRGGHVRLAGFAFGRGRLGGDGFAGERGHGDGAGGSRGDRVL